MTDTQHETHNNRGDLHIGSHANGTSGETGSEKSQHAADRISEVQEEAFSKSQRVLRSGIEAATNHARTASERMTAAMGFSGQGAEELAKQSKQNIHAISQYGAILGGAFSNGFQRWIEIGQKQWQRNLDGLDKLARSKSVHEFSATHGELARERMQQIVNDCHVIAEASLKTTTEASAVFKGK